MVTRLVKVTPIVSIKTKAVYLNDVLGAAVAFSNNLIIRALGPHTTITPLEIKGFHGLNEDPANQNVELYLMVVDRVNLPDSTGLRTLAAATWAQHWVDIGTVASVVQTLEILDKIFFNANSITSDFDSAPVQRYLALITNDLPNSEPAYVISAQVTFEEVNMQRRFTGADDFDEDFYSDVY